MTEFEIIRDYFDGLTPTRDDVVLGIGDDAALLAVPPGQQLAVSTDTLVGGVHFLPDAAPRDVGFKSLAVNLSDLAAMAAEPRWATLALTLPAVDPEWLQAFAAGFAELANQFGIALVGGNLSRGPLSITVQIMGMVPPGLALRRDGARIGDQIHVTGELGSAGYALRSLQAVGAGRSMPDPECLARLLRPLPRIAAGLSLRGIASAAIDLSDGLHGDLGHLCDASRVAARVELDRLPVNAVVRRQCGDDEARELALAAGDDYELCITVPPTGVGALESVSAELGLPITRVGEIVAGSGVRYLRADGSEYVPAIHAYRHF